MGKDKIKGACSCEKDINVYVPEAPFSFSKKIPLHYFVTWFRQGPHY
jgi:hypothetical protein